MAILYCSRHHIVKGANQTPNSRFRGKRDCLTCSRARGRFHAARRRGEEPNLDELIVAVMRDYPEMAHAARVL